MIDDAMVWARMTFRAIRVMHERFVLVLVEDLTREKVQLHENEKLRQELEKRVERRTAELRKTNDYLTREVAERIRAEEEREKVIIELQEALAQVKKLSGLCLSALPARKYATTKDTGNKLSSISANTQKPCSPTASARNAPRSFILNISSDRGCPSR